MRDNAILITGATSGIGRATAHRLAQVGRPIVITGRRKARLHEVAEELFRRYHVRCLPLTFDIRDENACQQAVDQVREHGWHIDVLVNNAGLAKGLAPIHDGDTEHWRTMIDTNITGLLYITRAVSPHMVAERRGQIINVASIAGKQVYPMGNVYCATKHAVDALTRGMRLDLLQYGVRVSQVAPGHVEATEFAAVRFDGDHSRAKIYEDFNPVSSSDVADCIHFIMTAPPHMCVQDMVVMGTHQADANHVLRAGRSFDF